MSNIVKLNYTADEINEKLSTEIVHTTGESESAVMSQKAVTDTFNGLPIKGGIGENSAQQTLTSALSKNSHSEGDNTVAGSFGYRIISYEKNSNIITLYDYQGTIINELAIGDVYSAIFVNNYDLWGSIESVSIVDNTAQIKISNPINDTLDSDVGIDNLTSVRNVFFIPAKPTCGYIDIGRGSHTEGYETQAVGLYSHAEGCYSKAYGKYSHAEGIDTVAAYAGHAEGNETKALGLTAHAEGFLSEATGKQSHAEGYHTLAEGEGSHAEGIPTGDGDRVTAKGRGSHAEGIGSQAIGGGSHAEGGGTNATANFSHAEGQYSKANGEASHAEGYYTEASTFAHAEGDYAIANGISSHAEGQHSHANGMASHAEGYQTYADGSSSHAEGSGSMASGASSHAEGFNTLAEGEGAHAEGVPTGGGDKVTASGRGSHAEGIGSQALGGGSHSEGGGTTANADFTHAEGQFSQANGVASHAEGYQTNTSALGAHAEGNNSVAEGQNSHAEGHGTKAYGLDGHAEGENTVAGKQLASGEDANQYRASHAEGIRSVAQQAASHAEGIDTKATGIAAHAEGIGTIASSDYQHVQGKYNKVYPEMAHIVGGGDADSDTLRANIHTLDWFGNAWYRGELRIGGGKYTNGKPVATKEDVEKMLLPINNQLELVAANALGDSYVVIEITEYVDGNPTLISIPEGVLPWMYIESLGEYSCYDESGKYLGISEIDSVSFQDIPILNYEKAIKIPEGAESIDVTVIPPEGTMQINVTGRKIYFMV